LSTTQRGTSATSRTTILHRKVFVELDLFPITLYDGKGVRTAVVSQVAQPQIEGFPSKIEILRRMNSEPEPKLSWDDGRSTAAAVSLKDAPRPKGKSRSFTKNGPLSISL
jgi:hypothetical protein